MAKDRSNQGIPGDGGRAPEAGTRSLQLSGDPQRRNELASMIEAEIIPRLLLLGGPATLPSATVTPAGIEPGDVDAFTRLLAGRDPELTLALAFVDTMRQRGVRDDDICLHLIAPTAHRLAQQWEQDALDSAELALGLVCLRDVVLEIGRVGRYERQRSGHA